MRRGDEFVDTAEDVEREGVLVVVGFEVSLDVGLEGVASVDVFGSRRVVGVGGGFECVDEGSSGPSGRVEVSVGRGLVAEGGAGTVLASDVRQKSVLLSPNGARFIGGADNSGLGGET